MPYDKQIIIALDFAEQNRCMKLLEQLDPSMCRVKIGKELFTRFGPKLLKRIQDLDFDVFLDLKFYDIPNTVASALKVAADLGVWMVNVHASGGRTMLEAAREALQCDDAPLLIGVTVLTSLGPEDLTELGINNTPQEQVQMLARLAEDCGLDGVVCSAQEAPILRSRHSADFKLVTPGIRTVDDNPDDQKRIVTPVQALAQGSDYLVIGRPVTRAEHPGLKLKAIIDDIRSA